MKQCKANPWEEFSATVQRGDRVKGPVKSITDFGVFVGLAAGIDGLVHLSDLSWNEPGESAVRNYKKGQEVEAIVLAVDVDRERISLGIKQLDSDPFTSYSSVNDRGALVTGKVKTVDARGAEIQLNDDITGYLRASEISRDRVEDARNVLKEGDEVNAMIINVDRKARSIQLSIKAKDNADQQEAMQRLSQIERARDRRHDQPGRAAARQARQQARVRQPGEGCMTRSDLVVQLAERFGQLTHRDTEFAVKTILDAMASALARGHRIEIRGFGSFSINRRPPRVGRNPRSGEQVVIPEKLVPHFKPGKALREAVDARVGAKRGEPAEAAEPPPRIAAGD